MGQHAHSGVDMQVAEDCRNGGRAPARNGLAVAQPAESLEGQH